MTCIMAMLFFILSVQCISIIEDVINTIPFSDGTKVFVELTIGMSQYTLVFTMTELKPAKATIPTLEGI